MSDDKFLGKYRMPSVRLQGDYYSSGLYFVTICTEERNCFFGNIVREGEQYDAVMRLSSIGQYAVEQLQKVRDHYPYAEIPLFVVMPNHIHAIVNINDFSAETGHAFETGHELKKETGHAPSLQGNVEMQRISHRKGKLSIVIGGIKSAISRYANAHNITFGWQARFHDRIIRNHQELNNVAAYIEQNVSRWNDDEFNMKSS